LVALFQATNKFKTEAYSVILGAVLLTIIVVSHYILKFSFEILCLLFVFSHLVKLIWLLVNSKQVNSIKKLTYNKNIQNYLFKNSWSFGLHYIIGVFYFSVDTQIISKILGINQLALYSSAFRVITAILLFSNIITQVFLPYLSSRYKQIDNQFKDIVQQLILVVFCCTYFIGTVMIIFREEVMSLLYKVEYIGSAILFMPLLFMCLLRGMAGIFGILLTISNHQEYRVKAIIASLIISFVSNYILIPIYKIQGAAFASMLTHMVLLMSYIFYVYRIYRTTFMNKKLILIFIATNAFTLVLYLCLKSKLLSLIFLGILLLIVIKYLQREILYFFEIIKGNFNNSNTKIS
jgi:O-antigen/teichoic acid export membrane protein